MVHEQRVPADDGVLADHGESPVRPPDPPVATEEASSASLPSWVAAHQSELLAAYNPSCYDFEASLLKILEAGTLCGPTLQTLHQIRALREEPPPLCSKLMHSFRGAGWKMPTEWGKAMRQQRKRFGMLQRSEAWQQFMSSYHEFIREEIAPLCGDPQGIVYQSPPTLRVAMPARAATIQLHKDSDYERHQPGEINFWVPVTPVWGHNTLHAESKPGAGDFRAMEMDPGQFLRFHGFSCRHYTLPNDTGSTRVSFDLRAVPASVYRDLSPGDKNHSGKIGDYGTERTGPVRLRGNDDDEQHHGHHHHGDE